MTISSTALEMICLEALLTDTVTGYCLPCSELHQHRIIVYCFLWSVLLCFHFFLLCPMQRGRRLSDSTELEVIVFYRGWYCFQ